MELMELHCLCQTSSVKVAIDSFKQLRQLWQREPKEKGLQRRSDDDEKTKQTKEARRFFRGGKLKLAPLLLLPLFLSLPPFLTPLLLFFLLQCFSLFLLFFSPPLLSFLPILSISFPPVISTVFFFFPFLFRKSFLSAVSDAHELLWRLHQSAHSSAAVGVVAERSETRVDTSKPQLSIGGRREEP